MATAAEIAGKVDSVDLLVMSPGYVSLGGREEWEGEGVDKLTSVRYYSRMAFVWGLRAQLQASTVKGGARVVSVLAEGKEGEIWREDLLLKGVGRRVR